MGDREHPGESQTKHIRQSWAGVPMEPLWDSAGCKGTQLQVWGHLPSHLCSSGLACGDSCPGSGWAWALASEPCSPCSPTGPCICALGSSVAVPTMEGPLRRKTLLKEGRKPAVSAGLAGRPYMREHWGRRSPQSIGAISGVTPLLASALHSPDSHGLEGASLLTPRKPLDLAGSGPPSCLLHCT